MHWPDMWICVFCSSHSECFQFFFFLIFIFYLGFDSGSFLPSNRLRLKTDVFTRTETTHFSTRTWFRLQDEKAPDPAPGDTRAATALPTPDCGWPHNKVFRETLNTPGKSKRTDPQMCGFTLILLADGILAMQKVVMRISKQAKAFVMYSNCAIL